MYSHKEKRSALMVFLSVAFCFRPVEEGLKHNARNSQPFSLLFVNVDAFFSHVTSFSFMDFISFELKEPWSKPLPADNLTHTYTHRLSVMDELFAVYWSTSFSHFIWIYHNKLKYIIMVTTIIMDKDKKMICRRPVLSSC